MFTETCHSPLGHPVPLVLHFFPFGGLYVLPLKGLFWVDLSVPLILIALLTITALSFLTVLLILTVPSILTTHIFF